VCALLAFAAGDVKTATGPITALNDPSVFSDGGGTTCKSTQGALKEPSGTTIGFNVGGVLTDGKLAPDVQQMLDTVQAVRASGGALVVTITYSESQVTLCGWPHDHLVATAVSAPAPTPTPSPTATPPPQATPTPTPTPTPTAAPLRAQPTPTPQTTGTVTGTVSWSPGSALVAQAGSLCQVWKGTVKPASGAKLELALVSPATGSPKTGWQATDARVVQLTKDLQQADLEHLKTTVTYTGPVDACGVTLDHVVTSVVLAPGPKPKSITRSGTIYSFALAGEYQGCRVWTGTMQEASGFSRDIAVVTPLRNGRATDPNAPRLAKALRRALTQHHRARVTFAGPITTCGVTRRHVVLRVTVSRGRSTAS
jgi:hypothetical protein